MSGVFIANQSRLHPSQKIRPSIPDLRFYKESVSHYVVRNRAQRLPGCCTQPICDPLCTAPNIMTLGHLSPIRVPPQKCMAVPLTCASTWVLGIYGLQLIRNSTRVPKQWPFSKNTMTKPKLALCMYSEICARLLSCSSGPGFGLGFRILSLEPYSTA